MNPIDLIKSTGEEKLDALQTKLIDTIEFYNDLLQTATPSSVLHVTNAAEKATEKLVPKLPESELKKWNTRAASIEKINAILINFENEVAQKMSSGSTAILLKEVHKLYKKFAWILANAGMIVLLIAESLGLASGLYGDQIKGGISKAFDSLLSGDWSKILEGLKESKQAIQTAIEFASKSVTLGLLAAIMEGTVAAFSAGYYVKAIQPIIAAKKAAEAALMKAAFPQSGKRRRTVKASKRN